MKNPFNRSPKSLNARGISHIMVPLLVVMLVAVGGTFMLVSSHAATNKKSSNKVPTGYLVIHNDDEATYSSIQIAEINPNNVEHTCGSKLSATKKFTMSLSVPKSGDTAIAPKQINCSAVGGNTAYAITYAYGTKSDRFVTTDPEVAPQTVNIDVDHDWCTNVYPNADKITKVEAVKDSKGKYTCPGADTKQEIQKVDLSVNFDANVLESKNYINGLITFKAKGIQQKKCTGQVNVTYETSNDPTFSQSVSLPIKWANPKKGADYCVVKLTQVKPALKPGTYTINLKYYGSSYFNALPEAGVVSPPYAIKASDSSKKATKLVLAKVAARPANTNAVEPTVPVVFTLTAKDISSADCVGKITYVAKNKAPNSTPSDLEKQLSWDSTKKVCKSSGTYNYPIIGSASATKSTDKIVISGSFAGNDTLKASKSNSQTVTAGSKK